MKATYILSEICLAIALTQSIIFFGNFLWETSGLLWVFIPIGSAFIFGMQITRLFFIYKGE